MKFYELFDTTRTCETYNIDIFTNGGSVRRASKERGGILKILHSDHQVSSRYMTCSVLVLQ